MPNNIPITLIASLGIIILALIVTSIVCITKAKRASEMTFICPNCGKAFSPTLLGAMGANMNFGDESVLVKCTECGKKDRMIPHDIR